MSIPIEPTAEVLSDETPAPNSPEGAIMAAGLERYFRKLYESIDLDTPNTLHELGFPTDSGPLLQGEEQLMSAHYDAPDYLFDCFLDKTYRAYSMAYYAEEADAVRSSTLTLEQAQTAKFGLICERAGIKNGDYILNIGCGFGSLETYLLKHYPDSTVTGVTASQVQADYIRSRSQSIDDVLSGARFRLVQANLNTLSIAELGQGVYDRVISIAVLEQMRNIKGLCGFINHLLRPGGTSFHHFITSKYVVPQFLDAGKTRIGRYFPGGIVWPRDALPAHCSKLEIEGQWYVNGMNYWRTLDDWHIRFWEKRDLLLKTGLTAAQIKHWNEFFYLCKAMFSPMEGEFYGNSHYLLRKMR